MDENEIVIVNSTVESSSIYNKEYINKHANMNHVVATARHFWHLEGIKSTGSTKLTNVIQVDLGGFIPHQIIDKGAVDFLSDHSVTRKIFCRDYEIDLNSRVTILNMFHDLDTNNTKHTEEEKNDVQRAR